MKKLLSVVLCTCLLISVTLFYGNKNDSITAQAAGLYPPDTDYTLISVPTVTKPTYLGSIIDPTFGTKVTRITDKTAFGASTNQVYHHYSKDQPWSKNSTKIKLKSGSFGFLNGSTYSRSTAASFSSRDTLWSNLDDNKMFGVDSPNKFVSINATTNVHTTLYTFSDYAYVSIGNYEGNLSKDDKYVAFNAYKSSNSSDLWIIYFNVETNTIISQVCIPGKYSALDWVTVSQSGNYILCNWSTNGTARYQGIECFTPATLITNQPIQLCQRGEHGDVGYNTAGQEVWVAINYEDIPNTGCTIYSYRLSDGARVVQMDATPGIFMAHTSCRNIDRPGWAYVTTDKNWTNQSQRCGEVMALKLDGSGTVERFAFTHTTEELDYYHEAHGVPNRDGTKVMFVSDWDTGVSLGNAAEAYSYIAEVVLGGSTPTPGPTSTPVPATPTPVPGVTLVSIAMTATNPTVAVNGTTTTTLIGTMSDGSQVTITPGVNASVSFYTRNSTYVTINSRGLATGKKIGSAAVYARARMYYTGAVEVYSSDCLITVQ